MSNNQGLHLGSLPPSSFILKEIKLKADAPYMSDVKQSFGMLNLFYTIPLDSN
jgi:hypothetical protein